MVISMVKRREKKKGATLYICGKKRGDAVRYPKNRSASSPVCMRGRKEVFRARKGRKGEIVWGLLGEGEICSNQ